MRLMIERGVLSLGKQPNGLILASIWESKPIAWRPRPLYQFDFGIPELEPAPMNVKFEQDIVAQYHEAYLAEKAAWGAYDMEYQLLVNAWYRDEIKATPRESTGFMPETQIRIYEVKVK